MAGQYPHGLHVVMDLCPKSRVTDTRSGPSLLNNEGARRGPTPSLRATSPCYNCRTTPTAACRTRAKYLVKIILVGDQTRTCSVLGPTCEQAVACPRASSPRARWRDPLGGTPGPKFWKDLGQLQEKGEMPPKKTCMTLHLQSIFTNAVSGLNPNRPYSIPIATSADVLRLHLCPCPQHRLWVHYYCSCLIRPR